MTIIYLTNILFEILSSQDLEKVYEGVYEVQKVQ